MPTSPTLSSTLRVSVLAATLALAACASSPPATETYHLQAQRKGAPYPVRFNDTVLVSMPRALPLYAGNAFVYQEGPQRFAQDPFRLYSASLPQALQEQIVIWLGRSGLFAHAVPVTALQARYVLEVEIREVLVDVRADVPHTAQVQWHGRLRDNQTGAYLLDQTFIGQSAAASPLDGASVIAAESEALAQSLVGLEGALVGGGR
ncbi:hypothetical protein JCM19000A_39460 [Silvimonas sp. JCM 19000]